MGVKREVNGNLPQPGEADLHISRRKFFEIVAVGGGVVLACTAPEWLRKLFPDLFKGNDGGVGPLPSNGEGEGGVNPTSVGKPSTATAGPESNKLSTQAATSVKASPSGVQATGTEVVTTPENAGNVPTQAEATATPGPDIQSAITKFNLDPERTYTLVKGRLIDIKNGAAMAKLENGKWVDTTLEDKYGHLAPKDKYYAEKYQGNLFFDDTRKSSDGIDPRYETVGVVVWAVGNAKMVREYNQDLKMDTDSLYESFVFRDTEGKLIEMKNVRIDVALPDKPLAYMECTVDNGGPMDGSGESDHCGGRAHIPISSPEEELGVYDKPGEAFYLAINYKRPTTLQKLNFNGRDVTNLRHLANYFDLRKYGVRYQELAQSLLRGRDIVIPEGWTVVADYVARYMTVDQVKPYFVK